MTSAPPDTDAVFAALKAPGIFHAGDLLSSSRGNLPQAGGLLEGRQGGEVPWGREVLAGYVGQMRRTSLPRHGTKA